MNAQVKPAQSPSLYAEDEGKLVLPPTRIELCAAKDDVRYYLNWPYLDLTDEKRPMLVASNGHVLAAAPVTIEGKVSAGPLPIGAIRAARAFKLAGVSFPTLYFHGEFVGTTEQRFRRPDGDFKYPDWRKVVPELGKDAPHDIAFQAGYAALMEKVFKTSKYTGLKIYCAESDGYVDPDKAMVMRGTDTEALDTICVVMPIRA